VIANETVTGDALSEQLIRDGAPRPILDVVAPVLQSRTHFVTTDIDRETAAARRRLRQTLLWAAEHDIEATGVVGDPIAPLAAIEDELRRHDFDEVILAMHPQEHTNWLETQLLERARAQLSIPVRRLVIDQRAPSHDDATPSHDDATPSHDDATPSHDDATPSHDDAMPSHDDATPSHDDAMPSHHGRDGPERAVI
jgi:hypothetical protein